MTIGDKTPDFLLLHKDFIKRAGDADKQTKGLSAKKERCGDHILAILLGGIPSIFSLVVSYDSLAPWARIAYGIFIAVFSILLIVRIRDSIDFRRRLKSLAQKDISDVIIDEAKTKIHYTAILVIAFQEKGGGFRILTSKDNYFLAHCPMQPTLTAAQQRDAIINYLQTEYPLEKGDILDAIPMAEEPTFSIKPVHNSLDSHAFIVFSIRLKKRAKSKLINMPGSKWMTIPEMREHPMAMGTNRDVIDMVDRLSPYLNDSFYDNIGPLHIIWNITCSCDYNCAICATRDPKRAELSTADKHKVLNSISTAKSKISILDFAGGDPCCSEDSIGVVESAINILNPDRVSVTTTGKGLSKISNTPRLKTLTQCEITIDASHESLSQDAKSGIFSRLQESYSTTNIEMVYSLPEHLRRLVINIPILDDDLSDSEINALVRKISEIKSRNPEITLETQLLRLMPVGAFASTHKKGDYLKHYDPIELAKKIKQSIDAIGIPCRYHCSLRILPKLGDCSEKCTMLSRKLGIDCAGNVFACAWGGYVMMDEGSDADIKENPFYLGNLLETDLSAIVEDNDLPKTKQYLSINKSIHTTGGRSYCGVISYYGGNGLSEDCDPLSKN